MRDARRWLVVVLILLVLAALLFVLVQWLGPILPGGPTPTPTSVRALPPPVAPGVFALVRRDDYAFQAPAGPGLPAFNSHLDVYWQDINPQPGVYRWNVIEEALARLQNQTVQLADGTSAPRRLWLTLPVFWTQGAGRFPTGDCANDAPGWVPYYEIPNPNTRVVQRVPAVDQAAFRQAYREVVLAAGARWANEPRIAGIFIAGGYDNETQLAARHCGLATVAAGLPGDAVYGMIDFVSQAVQDFHEAFPNKPVYLNAAASDDGGASRCRWVSEMLRFSPRHMGLGFNGMQPDVPGYVRHPFNPGHPDVGCGPLDLIAANLETMPLKFEPAQAMPANQQWSYWSWLFALAARVDFVDLQDGWFCTADPVSGRCTQENNTLDDVQTPVPGVAEGFPVDFGAWLERQFGKNASNADQLWVALRDTEFPAYGTGAGGLQCNGFCTGWSGDFEHYLRVSSPPTATLHLCQVWGMSSCSAAGLPAPGSAIYSRHARQMLEPDLGFALSGSQFAGQDLHDVVLRVAYVDSDNTPFNIDYARDHTGATVSLTVERTGSGMWRWATWTLADFYAGNALPGAADLLVRYQAQGVRPILHMVWLDLSAAAGSVTATPPVRPTATPTGTLQPPPLMTVTPTPSPTLRANTGTPTPSATATPSVTPGPSASATPTPTASLTGTATPTASASPAVSATVSPTATAAATSTAGPTATGTASPTSTPAPAVTSTGTPSPSATSTPSATLTAAPVATATPTSSPSTTATPTPNVILTPGIIVLQQNRAGYTGSSDAYVSQAQPTANFAGVPLLPVAAGNSTSVLVRFDLDAIPVGIDVAQATLSLHVRQRSANVRLYVGLYEVTQAWDPSGVTWLESAAGVAWRTPGGSVPLSAPAATTVFLADHVWYSFDVTGLLQGWLSGTTPNHGVLLRSLSDAPVTYELASNDNAIATLRPRLTILYR